MYYRQSNKTYPLKKSSLKFYKASWILEKLTETIIMEHPGGPGYLGKEKNYKGNSSRL